LTLLLALILATLTASAAGAQDDGEAVNGTIRYRDAENANVPVPDVEIVVRDADGGEVGTAVSGADGTFRLVLPGPGDYTAAISVDTIPDGVTLRNPDRAELSFNLTDGQQRALAFPLIEGDGSTVVQTGSSTWESALRLTVDGLKFGLIIAMCSVGLSLIFGTTGLVNFAHGELVTVGAVLAYAFNVGIGLHFLIAAPLAMLITAALGGANDRFLWRPLRNRSTGLIAMLVISIGLSILVRYFILWQFSGFRKAYNQYTLQTDGLSLGPVTIVPREIVTILLAILTLVGVALVVQRTRLGKAMRAVSDNKDLAESSGIDVERVIQVIWIAGAGLAGLGGVLFGLDQQVKWDMGFDLLLLMFAAVTLGGLGTAYGALVGSIIVGLFVQLSTLIVAPELKSVGALLVLVIILLVRPQGILGQKERIG
jgi:branched-chain amino acid transport system permease protein